MQSSLLSTYTVQLYFGVIDILVSTHFVQISNLVTDHLLTKKLAILKIYDLTSENKCAVSNLAKYTGYEMKGPGGGGVVV